MSNVVLRRLLSLMVCVAAASPAMHAQAPAPGRGPQGPPGSVTLPVADYDRLLDRAAQPAAAIDTPPVPAIVGRADMRARVDGTSVRGTLQLDGEVFQRGAVKVPLVGGTDPDRGAHRRTAAAAAA